MATDMKALKDQMYNEFMRAFFDAWWKHTIDNNGDNNEYIDFEFSLEPYIEHIKTQNQAALRLFFVREAKSKMVAIKSIDIKDNTVFLKGTYDDTLIREEMEKNSYKYMNTKEKSEYEKKQEKKKKGWRNISIDI